MINITSAADSTGTIRFDVSGLENMEGVLRVALFSEEEGFPSEFSKAVTYKSVELDSGQVVILFENIPYGIYAAAFLHDRNRNDKMDTNWLGIPREGMAASNNASATFGPPSFEDSKFSLDQILVRQKIKMIYH
jgi:uncharacterized protein (DUF2141 family)